MAKSTQGQVSEFLTQVKRKSIMRRAKSPLYRLGRFVLPEEWRQKKEECLRKWKEAKEKLLFPERRLPWHLRLIGRWIKPH